MSRHRAQVLVVDDEPALLDGLTRTMTISDVNAVYRGVSSGSAALRQLDEEHYDVVVTDMYMPGMHGEELLVEVARRHPDVIRISMSGAVRNDRPTNAHQWIDKPCPPDELRSRVAQALWSRGLVSGERLREAVTRISAPVPRDDLRPAVSAAWQTPDPLSYFDELIDDGFALPPRLAQFVAAGRAALFAGAALPLQQVTLPPVRADQLLGAFAALETFQNPQSTEFKPLWEHSLRTAHTALRLTRTEQLLAKPFDVFFASVLHAVGKPVLRAAAGEVRPEVMRLRQSGPRAPSIADAGQAVIGSSHADVGAAMLGIWGWPEVIVVAVRDHHRPPPAGGLLDLAALVYVADAIELERTGESMLDDAQLAAAGLTGRLPVWRRLWDGSAEIREAA